MKVALGAQLERFEFAKEERAAVDVLRAQPMRVHDLAGTKLLGASTTQLLVVLPAHHEAGRALQRGRRAGFTPRRARADDAGCAARRHRGARAACRPTRGRTARRRSRPPRRCSPRRPSPRPSLLPRPLRARASQGPTRLSSGRIVTPELAKRKEDILRRAQWRSRARTTSRCSASRRDATPEQVQQAFFALAKIWHPDRVPKAIADVRDACATVFAHMSEAQQTLCDAKRRDELHAPPQGRRRHARRAGAGAGRARGGHELPEGRVLPEEATTSRRPRRSAARRARPTRRRPSTWRCSRGSRR